LHFGLKILSALLMNENIKYFAGAAAVVALSIGAVIYISRHPDVPPPEKVVAPVAESAPPVVAPDEDAIEHPVAEPETREPLPSLNESDQPVHNALEELMGKESVHQFVVPKELVRHIVVSVDNMPEEKVAERLRPVLPTPGRFAVTGSEDAPVLDPANFERYKPLVKLIGSTDSESLLATYTRYYPLFQEAYESLGHPPQYFNDRLIEVIDHLLATPDIAGPIALAQPNVLYVFADPKLEAMSAGQKVLVRMGPENARVVKDKLRELRDLLVAKPQAK
jgi:hypothetical protein